MSQKQIFRQNQSESDGRIFHTDACSSLSDTAATTLYLAPEVDSGSDDEIYKVDFDDEDLESVYDDDDDTCKIDAEIEKFFKENPYPVNPELAEMVIDGLTEMEVNKPKEVVAEWSPYRFQGMANFIGASEWLGLPVYYGEVQINAFLNYIHEKNYTTTTISSHFATIKLVGHLLGRKPSPKNMIKYKFVRKHGKQMKDNKVPVGRLCLLQLCAAADLVFTGYTAILAKTMFLYTYCFSMRISEFSQTRAKTDLLHPSHNITGNAVFTSKIGISVCFDSDKTSKFDSAIRHRTVK